MKKCNKIKKIAIAAVMASAISAQMLAASVSADSTLTLYYYNGVYYSSQSYASTLAGYTVSPSSVNTSSLTNYWYNSYTGGYYSSYSDARNASSSGSVTQPYTTSSSTNTASGTNRYYNASKGLYYPNYSSAVSASNNSKDVTTFSTTTPKAYFCMTNGIYYDTLAEAEAIAGSAYVIRIANVSSTSSTSVSDRYVIRYYSSDSGDYYLSYSEALSHSTSSSNISSTKVYTYDYWFCKENGLFYSTKSQALSHTINNDESMVEYVNASYYNNNYNYNYNYYNSNYPYYYNGNSDLYYYYSSMGYYPYYSNYYNYYNYGYPYYNSTSSTIFTGSAANGDPYISGNKKKAGWTYIAKVVNDANDGATVKVAMNKATTITKSVLSELKAKDVDLVLTMSNGAKWTINGDDISTAKDTDLTVQYSNYAIPDALVKKASSGAVSTAQIKLGDNTSFGFSASVTLSFSTRRAGCTANLYQYDASSKSLTLIDSTTISNSGSATFNNISNGGDFLIIIK